MPGNITVLVVVTPEDGISRPVALVNGFAGFKLVLVWIRYRRVGLLFHVIVLNSVPATSSTELVLIRNTLFGSSGFVSARYSFLSDTPSWSVSVVAVNAPREFV